MPANAHMLFLIIIKIANFEIIDVDPALDEIEQSSRINEDTEFVLSDNFEEFGFESTDMIQNLQIMFLFILILLVVNWPFPAIFVSYLFKKIYRTSLSPFDFGD